MDRFRTLKESHPATFSIAFSFDYDWDTIFFTLNLSLEITVLRLSNQWQENCWPKLLPLLYKWSFKITLLPFKSGSVRPRCFQFAIVQELFCDICHWTWSFSYVSRSSCLFFLLRSFERDGETCRQLHIGLLFFFFSFRLEPFKEKKDWCGSLLIA